jgi:hypothetical protein
VLVKLQSMEAFWLAPSHAACAREYKHPPAAPIADIKPPCALIAPREYTPRVMVEGTGRMRFKPLNTFFCYYIVRADALDATRQSTRKCISVSRSRSFDCRRLSSYSA